MLPEYIQKIDAEGVLVQASPSMLFLALGGATLILALYIASLTGKCAARRWDGNEWKATTICEVIMVVVSIASLLLYGVGFRTFQAIAVCAIFLYASYSDIKCRELDDWVHVIILTTAFIGTKMSSLPVMLFSLLMVGGVMLFVSIISKGGAVGGADIKMAAASSFLLGPSGALIGTIVGMVLAVIHNLWLEKKRGTKVGFPLVPYLSVGFMLAFFLVV